LLRVERVSRSFLGRQVLRNVSLDVARDEAVGLVGPNGSGKTTLLRIATGFLEPDQGRVMIADLDVSIHRKEVRRRLGYLAEGVPAYQDMRSVEYLQFRARIKKVASSRVDEVMDLAHLRECASKRVRHLSRGYRQRLGIADALLADPPLLLLDEPITGLDPVETRQFLDLLGQLRTQRAVVLCSHQLRAVEAIADRILVLVDGVIVGSGKPDELRAQLGLAEECALEDIVIALSERGGL